MSNVKEEIRYFSLFSGIGGFELGIERAVHHRPKSAPRNQENGHRPDGRKQSERNTVQVRCVGFSEIDKYATQIYQHHFPNHQAYGDVTAIDAGTLPDFDILCGGFPCQAFSITGKRQGFDDTRGSLFFEIARLAAAKRPRLLFLENVKGLLSHAGGNTFQRIIFTLDELGYDLQWQVLNSKNHGVPQNRERVFIVGHLRGTPRPQVFPFGAESEGTLGDALVQANNPAHSARRVYMPKSNAPALRARARNDETGPPLVLAGTINRGQFKETGGIALTLPASYYKGHDNHGARPMVGGEQSVRRLTPVECERLQGFPDGWTEGISDTQRYKCLGNAVTVNVIEDIARRLLA